MNKTKISLSAVIITFNEERNIERCLKSIVDIVDEIVIVDSFSTDSTIEICTKFGAKIVQRKFDGYGTQKQFATSSAKFDYILSLDADEELSSELQCSIMQVKENWNNVCYSFNRRNYYCNKFIRFCGWYPDKQIRLYNRLKMDWNNKEVHESVETPDNASIMWLNGELNHYTCTTIGEHQLKEKKYARINADILTKKGLKYSSSLLI